MKLQEAKIGYAGYSPDFSAPGDRRRFGAYAAARGLAFEPASLERNYNVVLATHNGDIAGWTARKLRHPSSFKYVFELADSYLTQTELSRRYLKGMGRYALGIDSRWSPDFLSTLIEACRAADAVICSTDEQAQAICRHNPNVVVSFDHFGDEIGEPKNSYKRSGKLRLVWEGQSTTLRNLRTIDQVLNDLRDHIELHVVTDPLIYRYFGRFLPHPSQDLLKGIQCDVHFHAWDRTSFARHVTSADIAVIPIDGSDRFASGKPENKLVMLWQLGMPVLASATPAYRRAMDAAGVQMTCASLGDWRERLEALTAADASALAQIGRHCCTFAERAYSKEQFVSRFDQAFAAAGFTISE